MTHISRGVLVTGASIGVGAAVARHFAGLGDRVVVHYHRNSAAAAQVLASLPGEGHTMLAADLADSGAVAGLAQSAFEALGRVDVLVNNAALAEPATRGSRRHGHPLLETPYDEWVAIWRSTLAVNLEGAAHLSWAVARHMVATPPAEGLPVGRIVNVGSRGAFRGEPDIPAYGAAKAGLHSLGQSLALALGPHGIAVTSVAPGFISATAHASAEVDAQSPMGRVVTPDEVAQAVVALSGLEFATGAVLDLNGASYLR